MPRHLKYLLLENGFSAQELAAWPGLAESVRSNTAGRRKMNDDLRSFIKCVVCTLLWLPWLPLFHAFGKVLRTRDSSQSVICTVGQKSPFGLILTRKHDCNALQS